MTFHTLTPSQQSFPYHKENDKQGIAHRYHPSQPCPLCGANTRHKSAIHHNESHKDKQNIDNSTYMTIMKRNRNKP